MENTDVLNPDLQTAYDSFYDGLDEQWRMLSAKYKARNILDVCSGQKFLKVLEVGAGDGSILHYLDEWKFTEELHALEISKSGVDRITERKLPSVRSVQTFDGYHIPFQDEAFDLVILSHVLEHVEFERMLLREIRRVAKNIVIEVPRDYRYDVDKRMKHFLSYGHINMYTPTSLRFLLQTEGFNVIRDKVSLIAPEVTRFNTFNNQKKKRSIFRSFRIGAEFFVKKLLISLGGRQTAEKFASSYTVFLGKTNSVAILDTSNS